MSEEIAYRPVVINSPKMRETPKATLWDWVKYFLFNLFRKPKVIKRKKELVSIAKEVMVGMEKEMFPEMTKRTPPCKVCLDAYAALKPQIFLSQIKTILTHMKCYEHPAVFSNFLIKYEPRFKKSEEVSRWINNL